MAEAPPTPADPVAGLIDIPLPPLVSLWPQTWTSRVAIAVLLTVLIVLAVWAIRRRWVNRYRREALAELDRIAHSSTDSKQVAANLALLVRRTALAAFPRGQVAALTGGAWLAFLDRTYDGTEFSAGPGRSLGAAAYQPMPQADNPSPLIDLVRRWIKVHRA